MSKKALGKGVAALFPTEQQELEDKSSNLEVKSYNLEPHNVEDISSYSEVISNNSKDKTKIPKVKTKNYEVKSSNLKGTTYNLEVMKEALADARQNPRISLWSPKSAAVLKYLRKTKPEFSISEEAGLLLEEAIMRKYPEIYEGTRKEHEDN